MPNNLNVGPNAIVSKDSAEGLTFEAAGFTEENLNTVYEVGQEIKSYKPGRPINPVTVMKAQQGYYAVMKLAADISAHVVPPIVESTGGGTGYDSAAQGYFNRMATAGGTLTDAEKTAYNQFVLNAKTHGYYAKLKELKIRWGGAAGAKLNAISSSYPDVWVGGMTYARFAVAGNGTTGYAKSGFIPSVDFTANNYSFGGWYGSNSDGAFIEVGVDVGSNRAMYILPRQGNQSYISAHSPGTAPASTGGGIPTTNSTGLWIVSRTSVSDVRVYKNVGGTPGAVEIASNTNTETLVMPDQEMYMWASNGSGTPAALSARSHSIDFKGVGLTAEEASYFADDLLAFLTAAG